ncbi:glycoside hydrolase family 3 protein [Paradesertivirga mongoliensis]|uniref:beta-N-acetylhexosaminidase n=1 Tax=Paradesertivirga mongoliensis TaxID=2100740 RepID=A0ABW4ZI93_9SPHI|nr:glycoside hydrolase family 3 N-terminal domain-containing protein [Pedobacter mongoliensis]
MSSKYLLSIFILFISLETLGQAGKTFMEPTDSQQIWVDSVFRKLTRKEKIAQLFFLRAHTDKGKAYEDAVAAIIKKNKVGGLVFFQGGPGRQAALTNSYQKLSEVPLLIAMDAEWGLGMRLDSTISYPYQMTLGAIRDTNLVYEMGKKIAGDFKRIGMHINFAPVVDVNNNPNNPVINYRSFGDNKLNVASKASAYMRGLQDAGILVSIKHFPGHGDTNVDSHNDLPVLTFSKERLDSLELYPFKELIRKGASGVMVAHMNIPALDTTRNLPSTLSRPIVTGLLKEQLGFKGLVFSDAMEMKGVVKYFPDGEADVRAIIAGNDVIELSENAPRSIKLVRRAIRQKRIPMDQIDESVKKILAAKYWAGLNTPQNINIVNVYEDLNGGDAHSLNQRLSDAAVTVLKSDSLLKQFSASRKTAIISLGVTEVSQFQKEMQKRFSNSTNFILSKIASAADIKNVSNNLRTYDQIVVAIHDYRKRPQSSLDYNDELKSFISHLAGLNTVTCLFANPYVIRGLPGVEKSKSLLVNYQNSEEMQLAAAKVLSNQMQASGRLPVTINAVFKTGDGIQFFPVPTSVSGQVE